ncbi:hypothetical protein HHK36_024962 [Tetracentron sinense]|uniref:Sugar phosphate transporter domain-containing protein n=1 Tax=Tetracentron sinense TaxID=13715 RepID=A0A835D560_TETSI|nr:hypothetical protein HHK36_024962 [Tetracentron sinense]
MSRSAFAPSPSTPFLKIRKHTDRNPNPRFNPISLSDSPKSLDLTSIHGVSGSSCHGTSPVCSSSGFNSWISVPSLVSDQGTNDFKVRAAAVLESADESTKSNSMMQLGSLFGLWYLFNIFFNIYNKQVLKVFPFPVTITALQFACGTVLVILMWTSNLYKRPKISGSQLVAILPPAVVHVLGNLFTNISLGKVSVSFTHTIKAMEPFFSIVLSAMFLGEIPTLWVVSSLVPIMGGVALASLTEASFNWAGFWSAMASNLTNQSRNVLSKKFMVKKELELTLNQQSVREQESLDNITLFSIITIMSFIMLAPVAIFMEGVKFTPSYLQSAGLNAREVCTRSLVAALCFHAYQQVYGSLFLPLLEIGTHACFLDHVILVWMWQHLTLECLGLNES